MWELDLTEGWAPKNWCFWIVVLEKTLESPLDCKEIQPVPPKGNQPWIFTGRTDAEAEAQILWPPDVKSHLIVQDSDAGKDWGQEEKGTTEALLPSLIPSILASPPPRPWGAQAPWLPTAARPPGPQNHVLAPINVETALLCLLLPWSLINSLSGRFTMLLPRWSYAIGRTSRKSHVFTQGKVSC